MIKDTAAKRNFWFPGFIFMIFHAIVLFPLIIAELESLQEI